MTEPTETGAAINTDRVLYREPKGDLPSDYYAPSVFLTEDGKIGMNVGGTVHVASIVEWHGMMGNDLKGGLYVAGYRDGQVKYREKYEDYVASVELERERLILTAAAGDIRAANALAGKTPPWRKEKEVN